MNKTIENNDVSNAEVSEDTSVNSWTSLLARHFSELSKYYNAKGMTFEAGLFSEANKEFEDLRGEIDKSRTEGES